MLKLILPLTTKDYNSDRKDVEPLALLVHPQQPLSYLERLIQSELPTVNREGKERIPEVYFRAEDSTQDSLDPAKKTKVHNPKKSDDDDDIDTPDELRIDGVTHKTGKLNRKSKAEVRRLRSCCTQPLIIIRPIVFGAAPAKVVSNHTVASATKPPPIPRQSDDSCAGLSRRKSVTSFETRHAARNLPLKLRARRTILESVFPASTTARTICACVYARPARRSQTWQTSRRNVTSSLIREPNVSRLVGWVSWSHGGEPSTSSRLIPTWAGMSWSP